MASCSVVIVSYQSGPILFATLKRVLAQEGLHEVLVVDNGNLPQVIARLQQMALGDARLQIITGQGNVGMAKGCNLAAAQARGDFLLFLHPDCLLGPGALRLTMDALTDMPGAMVAGAWLLNADGSEQMSVHPRVASPKAAFWHTMRFGRGYAPTSFIPGSGFEVPAVPDTYLCIGKTHFRMLGGFDEAFFLCAEDIELCRRARNMGKKVIKLPQVQVVHIHASTKGKANSPKIAWQCAKGLMLYFKKHDRKHMPVFSRWGLNGLLVLNHGWFVLRHKLGGLRGCGAKVNLRARLLQFLAMGLVDLPETKTLEGRQVLLTGATGQIGVCLLRRLVAEGASVVAVTRQEPLPFLHERVWWVKGDLADAGFVLPEIELDAVVHCAPLMHLQRHMARLAGMGVTRVVAYGSTALFSQAASKNWHEKELVDRLRVAEAEVEKGAKQALMHWTILRPTLVYGMEMDNGITRIMRVIRRFGVFPVYPPAMGKRHPVHVDDLAKAGLQVLDHAGTYDKAYNLSGADVMTFREMVERIFVSLGRKKNVVETTMLPFALDVAGKLLHKKEINAEIAYRMNDDLVFFHDSARDDFGFSPRGFLHEAEG